MKSIILNITTLCSVMMIVIAPAAVVAQRSGNSGNGTDKRAAIEERVTERKEKAEQKVAERREMAETRSAEKIQAACERRTEKIQDITNRVSSQASRLLGVIDGFNIKVQNFYATGQLTVDDYDEQIEEITAAQENAKTEIAALGELSVDIDCTDPDVVIDVAAYRSSAQASKEALKEYRKELVELISSMRSAAAEGSQDAQAAESDTDTDQTESNSELEAEEETESGETTTDSNDSETQENL